MLKKDKKKLILILKMLYYSANYFNLKKNGTVIIKKHWYSLKKVRTTVEEVFTSLIPRQIEMVDMNTAHSYAAAMSDIATDSEGKKVNVTFELFSEFRNATSFNGIMLEWDFTPNLKRKIHKRIKVWKLKVLEYWDNLEFPKLSHDFSLPLKGNTVAIRSLPSNSIISMQELLSRSKGQCNFEVVGRIISGNSDFDEKLNKIIRLSVNPVPG